MIWVIYSLCCFVSFVPLLEHSPGACEALWRQSAMATVTSDELFAQRRPAWAVQVRKWLVGYVEKHSPYLAAHQVGYTLYHTNAGNGIASVARQLLCVLRSLGNPYFLYAGASSRVPDSRPLCRSNVRVAALKSNTYRFRLVMALGLGVYTTAWIKVCLCRHWA